MLLQDTFTVKGNAFTLKPVFKNHQTETQAKNAKPGACSKDFFLNHMTIYFKKEWLDTYQRRKDVNKIGERLGLAYGSGYWTRSAINDWLPEWKNEEPFMHCKQANRCSSFIVYSPS